MKILLMVLMLSTIHGANLKYENLLQNLPNNFKLGYKSYNKQTHIRLLEFIPKNEKINDWSQMITTSIYHKNINITAKKYVQKIKFMWKNNCKNSFSKDLPTGIENGYEFALVMLYCPKSKISNKEELTWLKAIKGNDSFYSIQKAFTYNPNKEEIIKTMKYLKNIQVCDTRLKNCPK